MVTEKLSWFESEYTGETGFLFDCIDKTLGNYQVTTRL